MMRAPLACTFKLTDFYFQKNTPLLHVWELATPPRYHPKLFFLYANIARNVLLLFCGSFSKTASVIYQTNALLNPPEKIYFKLLLPFPHKKGTTLLFPRGCGFPRRIDSIRIGIQRFCGFIRRGSKSIRNAAAVKEN